MTKTVAKVIRSGRSRSVRLPAGVRLKGDEVYVERAGDKLVLSPRPTSWKAFFASRKRPTRDFMSHRVDSLPQVRNGV
jgi:antitoxin VapB